MTFSKGMAGIAKTGVALLFIVFLFGLFLHFILPTNAVVASPRPPTLNFSANNGTAGMRFNITINNSELGDRENISIINISFNPSVFYFVSGSGQSGNAFSTFFANNTGSGILTWQNTTLQGFIPWYFNTSGAWPMSNNGSIAFNFTLINKVVGSHQLNVSIYFANLTGRTINFTILVVDDVMPEVIAPVTNATLFSGTSPLFTSTQVFSINVTALDHNMSTVRFGNASLVAATNQSNGLWALNTTATNLSCGRTDGVVNNCFVYVNASDGTNHNTSVFIYLTIDSQAPNVTISLPTPGNTSSTNLTFNVSVLEPNPSSGVLEMTRIGQSPINYTLANNSGSWGYTNLSVPEGLYTLRFYVTDTLGNTNASVTYNISIDTTRPAVSGAVANDTVVRSTQIILINLTVTDTNRLDGKVNASGSGMNSSMSLLSGNVFQTNATFNLYSMGCGSLAARNCTIRFAAEDAAGNVNNSVYLNFTIDDVTPNVTAIVVNDSDMVVRAAQVFAINATALDNHQMVRVNFSNVSSVAATNQSDGTWLASTTANALGCTAVDGVCTVYATAIDEASNSNGSVFTLITIDEIRPNVTLLSPLSGNSTAIASVDFNVSVLDKNPANSTVAWVQITPSGQSAQNFSLLNVSGNWYFRNSSMPDGIYTAQFFISDAVGLRNDSVTVTFSVDSVGPTPGVPVIDDLIVQSTQVVHINLTVSDVNINQVNVTAGAINSSMSIAAGTSTTYTTNSTFNAKSVGCTTGNSLNCTLVFSTSDSVGHVNNSIKLNITVDDDAPNVTITSPSNTTIQTGSVSFNVTVLEPNADNASVALVQITSLSGGLGAANYSLFNNSGSWTFTNASMTSGTYVAQFFIYDAANNLNNTQSIAFTVDSSGPTGTLDQVYSNASASGVLYIARSVSINVTVTDTNGVKAISAIFQSGATNTTTVANNTPTGFSFNTTGVSDGTYNITITATDHYNNVNHNVARLQVVVDNSKPVFNWSYSYITKNITLSFSDIMDGNNLSVTFIAVKSSDGSNAINLTTTGTVRQVINSTSINITLKSVLYDDLEAITNTPWKIDVAASTINSILNEPVSRVFGQTALNITDYTLRFPTRPSVWTAGWRDFFVNQQSPGLRDASSLNGNYSVTNVLTSVAGNYDIIYYQSGSTFTSYVPGRPTNDFTTFTSNTSTDLYWIHMNATDAIEIA